MTLVTYKPTKSQPQQVTVAGHLFEADESVEVDDDVAEACEKAKGYKFEVGESQDDASDDPDEGDSKEG